jgi:2'-5' RNA ligase
MPEKETKRLFVAVFPPAHLVAGLQAAASRLKERLPARAVRWTRPGQIHLTLNFLGAVAAARLPEMESILLAACAGHRRHAARVAGLGCFPNANRPRILWAGLAGDLRPLEELKKALDDGFAAGGFFGEDRPFHAHLTIGRISELNAAGRGELAEALAGEQERDFGEWELGRVDLMESVLSPQGATYTTLKSIAL